MFKSRVLSVQYQSTENSTRGKNSTCFPIQRLKSLLWCSILRKQVTVRFPFVRIKQPSSRLTLSALRQGQKKYCKTGGSNPIGCWTTDRHVGCNNRVNISFEKITTCVHIHTRGMKNCVYRGFAVASHTYNQYGVRNVRFTGRYVQLSYRILDMEERRWTSKGIYLG